MGITVVKRSGEREPYDANKINLAIEAATVGLDDNITWVTQIASELELTLFDGITTLESLQLAARRDGLGQSGPNGPSSTGTIRSSQTISAAKLIQLQAGGVSMTQ